MGVPLKSELVLLGCPMDAKDFRLTLWALFRQKFSTDRPDITDERLLFNPQLALEYCDFVRTVIKSDEPLPDELILRQLINYRKTGKRPRPEKV